MRLRREEEEKEAHPSRPRRSWGQDGVKVEEGSGKMFTNLYAPF